MEDYRSLALVRYRISPFLSPLWQLRHNMTAYDACYVALAEALDAELVTLDSRLASAAGSSARVKLITL
jgi:predicted nucleic acid-binding protein